MDRSYARLLNSINSKYKDTLSVHIQGPFKELILENPNYKEQSPEQMDSVQHVEEVYAQQFANIAVNNVDIPFGAVSSLNGDIESYVSEYFQTLASFKFTKKLQSGKKPIIDSCMFGRIAIGTYGDDHYVGDYAIILDPGGNDRYQLAYDINNPHPVLIADADGDDLYESTSDFGLACGALSVSILIDYKGNDIYRAGNFSLGAGYFGIGYLLDKEGDDSYFGDTFTMGAGTFGWGLLVDQQGNDTYNGHLFCQGFGFVRGIGGIVDFDGNDVYTVQGKYPESFHSGTHYQSLSQGFGLGWRPLMSGGVGFIYDYGGNDYYLADFFAQGSSYWWSLGILYDKDGNDRYITHQYAQGAGAHMTLGILMDENGDDVYRSHGVCQGCGHDYSCGWLIDKGGNDVYSAHDLAQGAGQANGIGIFQDATGNDSYFTTLKHNTQGYGNPRRDYGSIGLFLDLDGDDRYGANGRNNSFWTIPSKWGGGLDRSIPEIEPEIIPEPDSEIIPEPDSTKGNQP